MKRIGMVVAVCLCVACVGALAVAQENQTNAPAPASKPMPPMGMMGPGAHKGMGQRPMCPMMKGMMDRSMVATSDGGVVILMGRKLIKYDKSLNLVKEVELKIDKEAMKKEMTEMMKDCPMMKGGMAAPLSSENEEPAPEDRGIPEQE